MVIQVTKSLPQTEDIPFEFLVPGFDPKRGSCGHTGRERAGGSSFFFVSQTHKLEEKQLCPLWPEQAWHEPQYKSVNSMAYG